MAKNETELKMAFPRVADRCAQYDVVLRERFSLSDAQVLLVTSPCWTRRLCLGYKNSKGALTKKFPGAKHIKATRKDEDTGESYEVEMWSIPIRDLEGYLVDMAKKEANRAAAKADPKGFYKKGHRKPTFEEILADMTPEQAELTQKFLDSKKAQK